MNRDDETIDIAAKIADGSSMDWPTDASGVSADDRAVLDELKAIAAVAALHRAPVDEDAAPPAARKWGPLMLLERIGEGRFGDVYAAWDARLQRRVALKLLHTSLPSVSASPTRAIDEARLLARVRHPHVLSVFGAECIDGQVGIWTEFIEGLTLESVLAERGPLPSYEVARIGRDLCQALAAVHAAGLLHRDIKAQNVMRETGGRIVLMDFGTGADITSAPSRPGDLSGTPLYLAPEIFAGHPATAQSDLYALAVLLFRLLTGTYPVKGSTLDDVRLGHEDNNRLRVLEVRPDVPVGLAEAIERGLASHPSARYDGASAFEDALKQAAGDAGKADAPPSPAVRRRQRFGRPALWAALSVAIAIPLTVALMRPTLPAADRQGVSVHPLHVAGESPIMQWTSPISYDGRRIAFNDGEGIVWLWEPATGVKYQVTGKADGDEGAYDHLVVSPDGSRVAYMWFTRDQTYELRVASAAGAQPSIVYAARAPVEYPIPVEWSRDATEILCLLQHEDGVVDLALITANGGPPKVLKTFHTAMPSQASLSPDRRWVVYDAPVIDGGRLKRDLFVVSTDGAIVRELVSHPANDSSPLWTPDGSRVFFVSDRSGAPEAWLVTVHDGVAEGEPARVVPTFRNVVPLGFTASGALTYRLDTTDFEVYRMPVDLSRQGSVGTPQRVGGHVSPTWSHDGQSLAYITRQPSLAPRTSLNRGPNAITVENIRTGRARELHPQLADLQITSPRWSPDGRSLLVRGTDLSNQLGYFRVDVETGDTSAVLLTGSPLDENLYGAARWSADGKAFFYRHAPRGIVARDLATGSETVIFDRKKAGSGPFGPSPNGRFVAVAGPIQGTKVVMVQTIGGPLSEVFRTTDDDFVVFQDWTSDGRSILFTRLARAEAAKNQPHELWIVSASGGDARDTGIRIPGHPNLRTLSLAPSGRELAYTVGETKAETWVIENFLPRLGISR